MDRRTKKRIQVLNEKLQKLRQRAANARKQPDEAGEPAQLERDIAAAEAELKELRDG